MKEYLHRGLISFCISAMIGLIVNLLIDVIVNAAGLSGFESMSPEYRAIMPTPAIAAYINVLLYGAIGGTFAFMTILFTFDRLGLLIQYLLYFLATNLVLVPITLLLWQLHHHPKALIPTAIGYGVTFLIMGIVQYRETRKDIREINESLSEDA